MDIMPTPRDDPALLETWKELENYWISIGLSRHQALKRIAERYNVHYTQVYRYLTPSNLNKHKEYNRNYMRNKRKQLYYDRNYKSVYRNLYKYLDELFSYKSLYTLNDIRREIYKSTNIRIRPMTLIKKIQLYSEQKRGPPLEEIEKGVYKLKKEKVQK